MDEAETTSETTETQPSPEKDALDFSALRGFQLVRAIEGENPASEPREDWVAALRLELDARAARLSESVDSALVLANDGVIRWLGDPIAKLAQGDSLFAPTAVVLADQALPETARAKVRTRIELWAAAYLSRLLGSLLELENLVEGSEVVRDVAGLLARSLGVLEREPIRSKIKALDQDARGELRKRGVRFGAYYIYLPALLKPAARALALHLAGLRASAGQGSSLVETLAPLASSGRTSLKADPAISRESYRIAGFRLCGERAVRVDIVERLADMIRAASGPSGAHGEGKTSPGFVVTPQMTSLTGCSGEQFASILSSLGYVGAPMRRSEFMQSSAPPATLGETPAPTAPADATAADAAAADTAPESPALPSPDVAHADATAVDTGPADAAMESPALASRDVALADAAATDMAPESPALPSSDVAHADAADSPPQGDQSLVEAQIGVPAEELPPRHAAPDDVSASAEAPDAPPATSAETEKSPAETSSAQADDEMIVVWRRAPRFQPGPARSRSAGRRPERPGIAATPSQTDAPQAQDGEIERPKFRRHRRQPAKPDATRETGGRARQRPPPAPSQEASPASGPPPSEAPSPRPDHRRSRNDGKPATRERPEQAKPAVNLDSPFAKLLELRPLLAKQNDKRS